MTATDYPDELKPAVWEKKKGSLPAGSELPDKLKALQKKHDAVDWKLFDPAWPKQAKTAAELEEAFSQRDRSYRGSVFPLKREANEVASAALKMAKDKAAAKPTLDAAKAIGAAVSKYASAIDDGVDELKKTFDKAMSALPKASEETEEDEPGGALIDPKKLLAQLALCKRDPDRTVQFGYVDGKGKAPGIFSVSPKVGGRMLFTKLQQMTGVKTGAYGSAWIDGTSLMLQLDKPLGGLVKKVRASLKAANFKIAKVVLWSDDGTVFEQDDDADEDGEAGATSPTTSSTAPTAAPGAAPTAAPGTIPPAPPLPPTPPRPAPPGDEAAFTTRLKALMPRLASAATPADAASAKLLLSEAGTFARKKDWAQSNTLLDRAEALLGAPAPAPAPPPAAGRFVHHAKVRIAWQMARQKLAADLKALEQAILAHYGAQPDLADLAQRVRRFDGVLETLDESLTDTLDEALNAAEPAQRAALHEQARRTVARYTAFVQSDPLLAALDDNPFAPLTTHRTLLKTMQVLDTSLA